MTPDDAAPDSPRLGEAEQSRIRRLRHHGDRVRSAGARLLLKAMLQQHFGVEPGSAELVAVSRTAKPVLHIDGSPSMLRANVAHAGHLVVAAVTVGREVGVDVESVPATDFPDFDAVALSHEERRAVRSLPPELRGTARADYWVRKEAYVKATGCGLAVDPRTLSFEGSLASLPMACFRPRPGYVAAVCVPGARSLALSYVVSEPGLAPPTGQPWVFR
ncbi:4'-phosphopantetheinyl transferase family protein [Paenarthrobacter sp. NPDC089989]|uniref:4'-phosphopantetheinyl transferase family protein n=1 Tax=unclassified Paenarthrobacter TaxID=2634190 RepID=UPI00381EABD9